MGLNESDLSFKFKFFPINKYYEKGWKILA